MALQEQLLSCCAGMVFSNQWGRTTGSLRAVGSMGACSQGWERFGLAAWKGGSWHWNVGVEAWPCPRVTSLHFVNVSRKLMETGLCQCCSSLLVVPRLAVTALPHARCHQWVPLLWPGAWAACAEARSSVWVPPPSPKQQGASALPGQPCLWLCCSLLPPAPSPVLVVFLELYISLL